MTRYCAVLLWAASLAAQADTLSLRNGTSIDGALVSFDRVQIRFRVNGNILTYSRANVAGIDFGSAPADTAPPPANTALAPANDETVAQVVAQFGQPEVIADGEAQIYIFPHWKVTFVDGRVTDAQSTAPGANRITTGSTSRLSAGDTLDDVRAVLGEPLNKVVLDRKKICIFKDLKVTFQDDKVTAFK